MQRQMAVRTQIVVNTWHTVNVNGMVSIDTRLAFAALLILISFRLILGLRNLLQFRAHQQSMANFVTIECIGQVDLPKGCATCRKAVILNPLRQIIVARTYI